VTTNRQALIEKLIVSLHLNVPERELLGSDGLSVEEIAAAVKRVFERNGVFPPQARPWKPGETVFEGFFLLKNPEGKVEMAWQRSHPIKPTELAEGGSTEYEDLDGAISAFIEREWSEGIDAIRIIPRNQR
jgi:hypothetical protein